MRQFFGVLFIKCFEVICNQCETCVKQSPQLNFGNRQLKTYRTNFISILKRFEPICITQCIMYYTLICMYIY